uniref:RNase H type-1 domain-containing protein n=1 Tax=Quercus lobata TaxID=97700 RepID=A0A7N2R3V3_QUELO
MVREDNWAESSSGVVGQSVWKKFWKLKIPNKVKVFGWRACHNALPTGQNLMKRGVLEDIWAGSLVGVQKIATLQVSFLNLVEKLLEEKPTEVCELFLVQAWFIWHQRNLVVHGGQVQDPSIFNRRAKEFLEDFRSSQIRLSVQHRSAHPSTWLPPAGRYKLNFDAAMFSDPPFTGYGAVIRNENADVMASFSVRGSKAVDSSEAELLACRRAIQFAIEVGITDVVIEGDNAMIMGSIVKKDLSGARLGHIFMDIQALLMELTWFSISSVKREANTVAHSLTRYTKNASESASFMILILP